MDKIWDHKANEKSIYQMWEDCGAFEKIQGKPPYTILMPPPNANASLHAGHAMYTVDDIFIRWKRMQGYSALWIPGTDHAGIETQYVYEKELAKKGKSRMDFDRKTLYKNIAKFVEENSGLIYEQFKKLGFSADWKRSVYAASPEVINFVYNTFIKMEGEGLVYRDDYIVNYCTHCGTSLAELEVKHIERADSLYYIKYPLLDGGGFITVATVRPETIFGDSAVAINPKDKRYSRLVGNKLKLPLTTREIPIVADEMVDMEFGTGAVKITPAHDPNDFEAGKRHNLAIIKVINLKGLILMPDDIESISLAKLNGVKVKEARSKTVEELQKKDLIDKTEENYNHSVTTCYKCGRDLEPSVIPNWFIKVKGLKEDVKKVIEEDKIKFHPKRFKKHMTNWLDIMHDWPISRQIAWAIRIPVWYDVDKNPDITVAFLNKKGQIVTGFYKDQSKNYSFEEIEKGLQNVIAPKNCPYTVSKTKPKGNFLQETDTFDTWFSSGQWPVVTLKNDEYGSLLPTDLLGTLSDILKFWVSRMIMFTLYLKDTIPFKNVYLWSMVADAQGVKMSKSKGNVVNPIDLVEKYGADALRFSLMYGTPAGKKVVLSDNKVRGMRNFSNKIWNVARFVSINPKQKLVEKELTKDDLWILKELKTTTKKVTASLENYKLNEAAEEIYDFVWHRFADIYIEKTKEKSNDKVTTRKSAIPVLYKILEDSIKLLHPFMPFVTEAIYQKCFAKNKSDLLTTSSWPI